MPWGLRRFQETGQLHFLTFSCYNRKPKLDNVWSYNLFECELEAIRPAGCSWVTSSFIPTSLKRRDVGHPDFWDKLRSGPPAEVYFGMAYS